jgi:hypothetical protein
MIPRPAPRVLVGVFDAIIISPITEISIGITDKQNRQIDTNKCLVLDVERGPCCRGDLVYPFDALRE